MDKVIYKYCFKGWTKSRQFRSITIEVDKNDSELAIATFEDLFPDFDWRTLELVQN